MIIIFALANIKVLFGGITGSGIFEEVYFVKHAIVVFSMIGGLLIFFTTRFHKKSYLLFALVLFISVFPFLIHKNLIPAAQTIVFVFAVYFLSHHFSTDTISPARVFVVLVAILIILGISFDVTFNQGQFIYNSFYGRPRLLLGYHHPKELGNLLVAVYVFYRVQNNVDLKLENKTLLIFGLLATLLFFVSSRNSLLFIFLIEIHILFLRRGWSSASNFILISSIITLPIVSIFFWDFANDISSLRLIIWWTEFRFSWFGIPEVHLEEFTRGKFHIDNFYLGTLLETGFWGLFFCLLAITLVFVYKSKSVILKVRTEAVLKSLITVSFFDAGLFSTGNILQLICWTYVMYSMRVKYAN